MNISCNENDKHVGWKYPLSQARSNDGFTMIEIAIVVTVMGLMMVVMGPSLLKWMPNYRLKAAAREFYGDLQLAKLTAIKTNRLVSLNVSPAASCPGGSYRFTYTDSGGNIQTVASGSMAGNICLDNDNLNGKQFKPTGVLNGTAGGKSVLSNSVIGRSYTITQAWSGRTRITSP